MKSFFVVLLAAIVVGLAVGQTVYSDQDLAEWNSYKTTHGKTYDGAENTRRLGIYMDTKNRITAHNARFAAGEVSFKMGINQFSDLLPEELPRNNLLRIPH